MSLKEQLQADLKTAMLSKQELRRDVIRFTQAALKNAELAKQQKLVKERSQLWQTGKVDDSGNPIVNEAERDKQLAEIAMPYLDELSRLTGEGTSLAVLRDGVVTVVAKREPEGPVRVVQEVGARRPVYCTAVGKALAAWLPEREIEGLIRRTVFERLTSLGLFKPLACLVRRGSPTPLAMRF